MATDVRKHKAPIGSETPKRQAFNDLSLSINDLIPVASVSERATLVTNLTSAGYPPSTSKPVVVLRADAPADSNVEMSTDGTTWRAMSTTDYVSSYVTSALAAQQAFGWAKQLGAQSIPSSNATLLGASPAALTLDASSVGVTLQNGNALRAPSTGLYQINFSVLFAFNSSGTRSSHLARNGTVMMRAVAAVSTTTSSSATGSVALPLTAGDLITLLCYQSSPGSLAIDTGDNSSSFSILRVS